MILVDQATTMPALTISAPWRGESGWGTGPAPYPTAMPKSNAAGQSCFSAPAWKSITQKNFAAIAALRPGWDGYSAPKIDYRLIYRGDRLLADAFSGLKEAEAPYIIPAADGSLQFEWRTVDYQLEFVLASDGHQSFWLNNLRTSKQIESDGDAAVQLLYRWARQIASKSADKATVPAPADEAEQLFAA